MQEKKRNQNITFNQYLSAQKDPSHESSTAECHHLKAEMQQLFITLQEH